MPAIRPTFHTSLEDEIGVTNESIEFKVILKQFNWCKSISYSDCVKEIGLT